MDDLIQEFVAETNESLAELDVALVRLERTPDDAETLSRVFRLVHTIKGTCGFLGLARLERLAHAAETVLGKIRDGEATATEAHVTLVLRTLDSVRSIVTALEAEGTEPAGDDEALIAALNAAAAGDLPAPQKPALAAVPAPAPVPAPTSASAPVPAETAAAPEAANAEEPAEVEVLPPATRAAVEATQHGGGSAQSIRVSVDVLEDLMTLASELVLVRNQLIQLARAQTDSPFAVPLQRLSQITSDLQEGVMKTRMQPVGAAWAKLPRLVRDLALELGKKIELSMQGDETELDRQVLELVRDPLTHMVRNSADHGLETPEERRRAGKPDAGRIMLNAYHEGGHIIIEISDDGRGLPLKKIRAKALAQGLATEAELAAMPDDQVRQFIFRAGFSTAQAITSVSGRGVGMDVVRTNIERIGGTVDVRSTEGKGSTFAIKIPLTLAIVSALIVQAGGERFALPQIAVVELVRVGTGGAGVEWIDNAPVMRLRDRLLPLVSLSGLLGLGDPDAGHPATGHVVVLQVGPRTFGLLVDGVFDTEEIVVKPVAPILRDIAAFSGNTILGDGGVIMILDPTGIARASGIGTGTARALTHAAAQVRTSSEERMPLLLFRVSGAETPVAIPLGLVARLERIPAERIEIAGGEPVVQYRGALMPLIPVGAWERPEPGATQPVLVFADRDRSMGLLVAEILDVVEDRLKIETASARQGFLGTAIVDGRATDVLDSSFWLKRGQEDWFGHRGSSAGSSSTRLLVVEDSAFFRSLVVPVLAAAGFEVTTAETAEAALKLRDDGATFDAVLSDIEMPGMDGFSLVRELRRGGAWAQLPIVALTSRASPADIVRGREAGFDGHCAKFDRDEVLTALSAALSQGHDARKEAA
jgi:two-component system chemotaxis sensor kinase CheA